MFKFCKFTWLCTRKGIVLVSMICLISACGADHVWDELEVNLTHFSTDKTDIYPGEEIHFVWEAESAFDFDVRFFLSEDSRKSSDDFRVIREDCGFDEDNCEQDKRIIYTCFFSIDNSFDCEYRNDLISVNDLTPYFEELPMYGYVIIEVCDETRCERASAELNFF